jgi:hypothetical protein
MLKLIIRQSSMIGTGTGAAAADVKKKHETPKITLLSFFLGLSTVHFDKQ